MISKHIPNTITSMNLLCGLVGVVFAFKGRFDIAFPAMLAASLCDFCDGFSARLLNAYSDKGRELDSLADVVSFGVLPSVMLLNLVKFCNPTDNVICYVPLLIAVFSALRLAQFNVDDRQHTGFIGLPTPACALLCGSLACYVAYTPTSFLAIWCASDLFIPLLTAVLCCLLVCGIPMFSMKVTKESFKDKALTFKRIAFLVFIVLSSVYVIVFSRNYSLIVLFTFIFYIINNLVYWIFKV